MEINFIKLIDVHVENYRLFSSKTFYHIFLVQTTLKVSDYFVFKKFTLIAVSVGLRLIVQLIVSVSKHNSR